MQAFNSHLYFITDSRGLSEEAFLEKVEAALQGGVTLVQIREKDRSSRDYLRLAEKVHALTKSYQVPLLVDDRLDIALAMDAEGVHLGQSDLPLDLARKLLGPDKILGATAKTVAQAQEAYQAGADYLGVGAIYPTQTKEKIVFSSVETLDAICRAVPLPVNAIGGLTKENIQILQGIPIAGICVVSAIMRAADPEEAARELLAAEEALGI